jgi:transcription-repair coupling factor (superfamily II helicase)
MPKRISFMATASAAIRHGNMEFEEAFAYELTVDQARAITDTSRTGTDPDGPPALRRCGLRKD